MADEIDDKDIFETHAEWIKRLISEIKPVEMKLPEIVERACKEPTLAGALSLIAAWECDRAIKQALHNAQTGERTAAHGGTYDTCFYICFEAVLAKYPRQTTTKDRSPL